MSTHASVAAKVRAAKEKWPLRYCTEPKCLWNLLSGPCPKHKRAARCDDPGAHQPDCTCDGGGYKP